MDPLLIGFPHGIGDVIMFTPVLRQLHRAGTEIHMAVGKRILESRLLAHCPYVESRRLYEVPDLWTRVGLRAAKFKEESEIGVGQLAERLGLPFVYVWGDWSNKVRQFLEKFGLDLRDAKTELFISDEDRGVADSLLNSLGCRDGAYGFVGARSLPAPRKNLPVGYGRRWLEKQGVMKVIEVGVDFDDTKWPVNASFEAMRRAAKIVLIDSCYYHAAHAMGKAIDLVWFREQRWHDHVRPFQEPAPEHVVCGVLPE